MAPGVHGSLKESPVHLVTKILIVFAALFAVLLAALAMAFSYNAQSLRDNIDNERAAKMAAYAQLNESQTAAQKEVANAKQAAEQATTRANAIQTDYANAKNERDKLMADLNAAQLDAAKARAESSGKDARLQTLTQLVASVNEENGKLRTEYVRLSKEGTEKDVRLADLESQIQVAVQNLRATQEQMADMVAAANKATAGTADNRRGTEFLAGPLVTGKVSAVTKAPSGDELATISVGSTAGVKVGQRMNIVRGGKFVGGLVIMTVDTTSAIGRIDLLGSSNKVMAEDTVLSRLN
jgi:multidrug efflux pump subunit AcrA (membrane-fusion protein)